MSSSEMSCQPAILWRRMHSLYASKASFTSGGSGGSAANGRTGALLAAGPLA